MSLVVVTVVYLLVLVWINSKRNDLAVLPVLASSLLVLFSSAAACWLLRYARWHWLLRRVGHSIPIGRGLLVYVAGFAFTATPGKVGELIRIRYLSSMGVPPQQVIAAFVYERALDLLVVLMIASLAATPFGLLPLAASFVGTVVALVVLLARNSHWVWLVEGFLGRRHFHLMGRSVRTFGEGLAGAGAWVNPLDLVVSLLLGVTAWLIQSLAFVWLLAQVDATVPFLTAIAVLPLAQLAGAASMFPGGIGSTEAIMISMLVTLGVPVGTATLAAVGMRIATLWGAIASGLLALVWLEYRGKRLLAVTPCH